MPNGTIFEGLYDLSTDPCNLTDLMLPPNVLTTPHVAAKAAMSAL